MQCEALSVYVYNSRVFLSNQSQLHHNLYLIIWKEASAATDTEEELKMTLPSSVVLEKQQSYWFLE